MGNRRAPEQVKSRRDWRDFVARNRALIDAAGLPLIVVESDEHWNDFLDHGYLDHHDNPTGFTVDQINERQYKALVQLVESYFAAGYDYFTPTALRGKEQRLMNNNFGRQ
jgi:hypothetical protein